MRAQERAKSNCHLRSRRDLWAAVNDPFPLRARLQDVMHSMTYGMTKYRRLQLACNLPSLDGRFSGRPGAVVRWLLRLIQRNKV